MNERLAPFAARLQGLLSLDWSDGRPYRNAVTHLGEAYHDWMHECVALMREEGLDDRINEFYEGRRVALTAEDAQRFFEEQSNLMEELLGGSSDNRP